LDLSSKEPKVVEGSKNIPLKIYEDFYVQACNLTMIKARTCGTKKVIGEIKKQ